MESGRKGTAIAIAPAADAWPDAISQEMAISVQELVGSILRASVLPLERQLDSAPVITVAVGSLRGADSPRLSGESPRRTRLLAHSDALLPPHRETMRVIDGMHRVRAEILRGEQEVQTRFYDGTQADPCVLAVKVNKAYGLPLSLGDRKAAAARIITSQPQWSDRAIADMTALSHKTVGVIRRRPDGEFRQMDARISQDGRVRPLDAAAGRRRAAELQGLIRLLALQPTDPAQRRQVSVVVPSRRAVPVPIAATDCANAWHAFADQLHQCARMSSTP